MGFLNTPPEGGWSRTARELLVSGLCGGRGLEVCCGRITVGVSNQTGLGEAVIRTAQAVLQIAEVTRVTATGHGFKDPDGHGSGHAGDWICHFTAGP